jgi:TPR repeat protein
MITISGWAEDNKTELYSAELVKKAEAGDATAQLKLADCYSQGLGVAANKAKALELYIAASKKYDEASYKAQKLITSYELQASAVNPEAMRVLGKLYQDGDGVKKNLEKSFSYFKSSAELGNEVAQMNLGYCYLNGLGTLADPSKALFWYTKSAESGNADAMISLSRFYINGVGTETNLHKAFELVKQSAEKGNAWAQNELGTYYEYGKGVTQDYKEAVKWYTKAAEQGNAIAQTNLGWCRHEGKGVTQDYKEAVKWLTKAAEQGDANGQNSLGWCYYEGKGVTQDYKEAVKLFTKAAEQGVSRAQNNLGDCYLSGKGVTKDSKEAMKWYTRAAEQGEAKAQHCYISLWYSLELVKRAVSGEAKAQISLGHCYYCGKHGVAIDHKEAVKWFTKAAEQGDEQSKKMLKILKKKPKIFSRIINRLKPSADIDGTTFVQFGIVGLASYHFNLKKDSFINYENRPKEWKYDDGSALSDKVYFWDEKYDPKLKEFSAYVVFEKPLFGVRLAEYKLKFDDLLRKIVSGGIQTYDSCGNPIKVKSLLVTFGDDPNKDLVYKRYDYSPTNPQQNP